MKMNHLLILLVPLAVLQACHTTQKTIRTPGVIHPEAPVATQEPAFSAPAVTAKTDTFLVNLLQQYPQYFDSILRHNNDYRVQIIYTQIDRQANNTPNFKNYYYNVDSQQYFYPASTVKMPVALLALQKLNELKKPGLDKSTTMITESAYSGQTPVYNDPTTPDGRPSIEQYIKKIFLVSDNDAFNRLYEFVGQQYINEQLRKMGYTETEIVHRLDIFLKPDENRHTNPVTFYDNMGSIAYAQEMQNSILTPLPRKDLLGKGFMRGNKLVNEPFDFSRKNRIGLEDLQNILRSVLFPESVPAEQRFNLSTDDYKFVWKYMSQYPGETAFPTYDSSGYWDAYCKFIYWGHEKGALPKNLRIFNKVGDAYGFLTDITYVVDFDKGIEFMLAASLLCNSDGIFNDSKYDYDAVGFPFLKNLGRVIYDYERKRPRANKPDLSAFKITYDK